jgi:hypothetical protein
MIKPKDPPYKSTKIDPDRTRVDIDKLLRKYGVKKIIWASDYESNDVQLAFEVEAEIQGIRKGFTVKVRPPLILKRVRVYNRKLMKSEHIQVPNWPQSMRILYWYLKSKIESVAFGLVSIEKEFLSQIMISLPEGNSTVGEALEPVMLRDKLSTIPALEHVKKVEKGKIIDV